MLDKLVKVEERFDFINEKLCEADVVSDMAQYKKFMQELKVLTPIVEKFRQLKAAQATLQEAREMLDAGGLEKDFREMVQEEYEEALSAGDMEKLINTDTHFHNLITQGSHNQYLIDILQDLQEQVLRFRYIYFKSNKRAEDVVNEHRMILNAIQSGNADDARKFSVEHIVKLRESIINEDDFHGRKMHR